MNTSNHANTRGSALLMAVLLVAILGIGTAALFKHLNWSMNEYSRFERDMKIAHLADAGIDAAIAALRNGEGPVPEWLHFVLGEGAVRVTIAPSGAVGGYHIVSEATLRHDGITRATGTYSAEVRLTRAGEVHRLSWRREKRQ